MECSIKYCETKAIKKGLCGKHYQRKTNGSPRVDDPAPGLKWCRKCNTDKKSDQFYKGRSECKACGDIIVQQRKESGILKIYQKRTDDRRVFTKREQRLLRVYGLSQSDFEELLLQQNSSCAICLKKDDGYFVVDHDHTTMKVRGILCRSCNTALGLMNDSQDAFSNAVRYLNYHNSDQLKIV